METATTRVTQLLKSFAGTNVSTVNMKYAGKQAHLTITGNDLPEDILRATVFGDKKLSSDKTKKKDDTTGPVRIDHIEGTDIVMTRGRKEDVERVQDIIKGVEERAKDQAKPEGPPFDGPVQIEFIEGTDIFITRGRKEDVDRVQGVIKRIQDEARLKALTRPDDSQELANTISKLEFEVIDLEVSLEAQKAKLKQPNANHKPTAGYINSQIDSLPQVKKLREEIQAREESLEQIEAVAKNGRESSSYINTETKLRSQRDQLSQLREESKGLVIAQIAEKDEADLQNEVTAKQAQLKRKRTLLARVKERYEELRTKARTPIHVEVNEAKDGLKIQGSKEDVERAEQVIKQGQKERELSPNAKLQVSYEIPEDVEENSWRLLIEGFLAGKGMPKENISLKFSTNSVLVVDSDGKPGGVVQSGQTIGKIREKKGKILTIEATHAETVQLEEFLKSLGAEFYVDENSSSLRSYRLETPVSEEIIAVMRELFADTFDSMRIQSRGPNDLIIYATRKQHEKIARVIKQLDSLAVPGDRSNMNERRDLSNASKTPYVSCHPQGTLLHHELSSNHFAFGSWSIAALRQKAS